jgi:hypothetical protein
VNREINAYRAEHNICGRIENFATENFSNHYGTNLAPAQIALGGARLFGVHHS